MTEYDDGTIYGGVDCFYSLWDDEQQRYVPAQPKRLYEVTLRQAYNDLITALEYGSLEAGALALNPERRAYTDVSVSQAEIPDDVKRYLAEHPEVHLNPANPLIQAALRIRMQSNEVKLLTKEQKQQRDWLHWQEA